MSSGPQYVVLQWLPLESCTQLWGSPDVKSITIKNTQRSSKKSIKLNKRILEIKIPYFIADKTLQSHNPTPILYFFILRLGKIYEWYKINYTVPVPIVWCFFFFSILDPNYFNIQYLKEEIALCFSSVFLKWEFNLSKLRKTTQGI